MSWIGQMRWISVGLAVASSVALLRQHWLHVGATPDERRHSLPGDELLTAPQSVSTQAITVLGDTNAVWPWVAQMGYGGRAGFYSYPIIEWVGGGRHTRRIHGLPDPEPGTAFPTSRRSRSLSLTAPPNLLVLVQRVASARKLRIACPSPLEADLTARRLNQHAVFSAVNANRLPAGKRLATHEKPLS